MDGFVKTLGVLMVLAAVALWAALIFFVPAAVAVMGIFSQIEDVMIKLVLITFLTTIIVFFVTSFTVSTVANLMARSEVRAAERAAAAGQESQKEA